MAEQDKIMSIYYGIDKLPYKDRKRETHYPIVGSIFEGENSVSKIRFYTGLIGGEQRQWIANVKKPDGTIYYSLMTQVHYDDIGEFYTELDVASLFTDQIGNLFISVQGYSGDVVITYDDDTASYNISGNPLVLSTGAIKCLVNYTPNVFPKGETLSPTAEQMILASLSNLISIFNGIVVIETTEGLDTSEYDNKQLFYDRETKTFYRLVKQTGQTDTLVVENIDINNILVSAYGITGSEKKLNLFLKDVYDMLNGNVAVPRAVGDNVGNNIQQTYPTKLTLSTYIAGNSFMLSAHLKNSADTEIYTSAVGLPIANGTNAGLLSPSDYTLLHSKVNEWQQTPDNNHYPSEKLVKDTIDNVVEIAEGKTKSFVLSYNTIAPTEATFSEYHLYRADETPIESWQDYLDYIGEGNFINNIFENENDLISTSDYNNDFLLVNYGEIGAPLGSKYYKVVIVKHLTSGTIKTGDVFFVVENDVPDRWFAVLSGFYKLDADKVSLDDYYTKAQANARFDGIIIESEADDPSVYPYKSIPTLTADNVVLAYNSLLLGKKVYIKTDTDLYSVYQCGNGSSYTTILVQFDENVVLKYEIIGDDVSASAIYDYYEQIDLGE